MLDAFFTGCTSKENFYVFSYFVPLDLKGTGQSSEIITDLLCVLFCPITMSGNLS